MMIPPIEDRRWRVARQMGIDCAIAKLAPELTGKTPPWDYKALSSEVERYRAGGFKIIGLEGDQFDMSRIKLGLDGRDEDIGRYCDMLSNMGRLGINLLCFNFMAYFGWFRTGTGIPTRGGALVSDFDATLAEAAGPTELGTIPHDKIWENYTYFIQRVVPAAEKAGVRMGLHPDDPPVPALRGICRVFTDLKSLERGLEIASSPALGITFCQGTLSTAGEDIVTAAKTLGKERIAFVHIRDVRGTAKAFSETFPDEGQIDMAATFAAYRDLGLTCPIRPDHAPAMDGDSVADAQVDGINVGYESNGMIFTVGYMKGLMQANGWSDA
ncbi:mannonate dehydratase [Celeribacter sp.]|uniref:mannonate dehydratase n=1 Tax=Celeribacter sp. TaxID=1890673 RepID=UPI003A8EE869